MALIATIEEFRKAEELFQTLKNPGETQEQFSTWWLESRNFRAHVRGELELLGVLRRRDVYLLEEARVRLRLTNLAYEALGDSPLEKTG